MTLNILSINRPWHKYQTPIVYISVYYKLHGFKVINYVNNSIIWIFTLKQFVNIFYAYTLIYKNYSFLLQILQFFFFLNILNYIRYNTFFWLFINKFKLYCIDWWYKNEIFLIIYWFRHPLSFFYSRVKNKFIIDS